MEAGIVGRWKRFAEEPGLIDNPIILQFRQNLRWSEVGLKLRLNRQAGPQQLAFVCMAARRAIGGYRQAADFQTSDQTDAGIEKVKLWFPLAADAYRTSVNPSYNFDAEVGWQARLWQISVAGEMISIHLNADHYRYLFNTLSLRLGYRLIHPPKPQKQDPYFMKSKRRD